MMEGDDGPVPQMLFVNEAFLHSQDLDSYDAKTSVVKQEDDEQCSQHSCVEIKTEDQSLDYDLSSHIYRDALKMQRIKQETKLIHDRDSNQTDCLVTKDCSYIKEESDSNQTKKQNELNTVSNDPVTFDCSRVKVESEMDVGCESNMASPIHCEKGPDQETSTDCSKIKLERGDSMEDCSSELFTSKQEMFQDPDDISISPNKVIKVEEHSDSELNCLRRTKSVEGHHVEQETTAVSEDMFDKFSGSNHLDIDCVSSDTCGNKQGVENVYKCYICDKTFVRNRQLTLHMNTHRGGRHECSVCDKVFSQHSYLIRHMKRNHTGDKCFKCDVCDKAFTTNSVLSAHKKSHSEEKSYFCGVCDKAFVKDYVLKTHLRIHTGEKPYKCNICDKAFATNHALTLHVRVHTGEKPYQCNLCDKAFATLSILTSHKRRHIGERSYLCTICDKAFNTNSDLATHKRRHTGEKPYKCGVCDRAFVTDYDLKTHIKTHTGERPYKCNFCDKGFIKRYALIKHVRVHTGEKPFKCSVCDKAFTSNCRLRAHTRTHAVENFEKDEDSIDKAHNKDHHFALHNASFIPR